MQLGWLGQLLRNFGIPTSLSRTNMEILCVSNFYSSEKSIRELGIRYQPIEQGIQEAIHWFKENGRIR